VKPSAKQQIYKTILEIVLPLFRNVESLPEPRGERDSYVLEADFIHNLPARLVEPDLTLEDIHWLNIDARSYVGSGHGRILYGILCGLIAELFDLVPESMRDCLQWSGPDESCSR